MKAKSVSALAWAGFWLVGCGQGADPHQPGSVSAFLETACGEDAGPSADGGAAAGDAGADGGDGGVDVGSGPIAVTISAPAAQSILTTGAPNILTAVVSGAAGAPEFFADGASIGTGVDQGGGVFQLSWTPTAADFDANLTVVYGSATSAPVKVAVAGPNNIVSELNAWSRTNIASVTAGQPDPTGGSAAYRVVLPVNATAVKHTLTRVSSPANTTFDPGFEVWAKVEAGTSSVLQFYWGEDGAKHYCYADLATGQTLGQWASCKIVESRAGGWKRVWFRSVGGSAPSWTMRLSICKSMSTGCSNTTTAGDSLVLFAPRVVDGPLPFTPYQLATPSYVGVVNGAHRWMVRTPYVDNVSHMTQPNRYTEVVLPDAYDPSQKYPVLYVGEVEARPQSYPDGLQVLRALNVHNDYNCILAHTHFGGIQPWYASHVNGTFQYDVQVKDVLVGVVDEFYSTIRDPEGRLLVGFSKGGFGAFSLLLRNPDVFGYAAAWDVPWTLSYGAYGTTEAFGSAAQFGLYNPIAILPTYASSVNDRTRLVLAGSHTFAGHVNPMANALTAQGIPFTLRTSAASAHNWTSGWLPNVLSDLFELRTRADALTAGATGEGAGAASAKLLPQDVVLSRDDQDALQVAIPKAQADVLAKRWNVTPTEAVLRLVREAAGAESP